MAQNLLVCQFCELSEELKWKCVQCNLILCDQCKVKIHTKIKKSEKHDILDLKDFTSPSISDKICGHDLHDIQCTDHADERCIIYCSDCLQLLCASCLLQGHQNHKLSKIGDIYHQKLNELKSTGSRINEHLPLLTESERKLEKQKSKGLDKYSQIKEEILQRESQLKDEVEIQTKSLLSDLDKLWKPQEQAISNEIKEINENKQDLIDKKDKIQEDLMSKSARPIFTSDETTKDLTLKHVEDVKNKTLIFEKSAAEDRINLGFLIQNLELRIINSYEYDEDSIYLMKTLNDKILISTYDALKFMQLENLQYDTKAIIEDIDILNMTVTKDGKLLFSLEESSEVMSLTEFVPDSEQNVFITIKPFYARGIHASDKNIFIGFKEPGNRFPLTDTSRRGIMVYDYQCRHMRTIEYDTDNQRLFSLPGAITININNDICVRDSTDSEWHGRIVVLGSNGNLKWTYSGHPSVNTENQFTPTDLTTTTEGYIIVADGNSHAVHVLSMNGNFLTSLNEKHGIGRPLCVNIDNNRKLQIGCLYGKIHVAEFDSN